MPSDEIDLDTLETVLYEGNDVEKLFLNNVLIWEKITTPTFDDGYRSNFTQWLTENASLESAETDDFVLFNTLPYVYNPAWNSQVEELTEAQKNATASLPNGMDGNGSSNYFTRGQIGELLNVDSIFPMELTYHADDWYNFKKSSSDPATVVSLVNEKVGDLTVIGDLQTVYFQKRYYRESYLRFDYSVNEWLNTPMNEYTNRVDFQGGNPVQWNAGISEKNGNSQIQNATEETRRQAYLPVAPNGNSLPGSTGYNLLDGADGTKTLSELITDATGMQESEYAIFEARLPITDFTYFTPEKVEELNSGTGGLENIIHERQVERIFNTSDYNYYPPQVGDWVLLDPTFPSTVNMEGIQDFPSYFKIHKLADRNGVLDPPSNNSSYDWWEIYQPITSRFYNRRYTGAVLLSGEKLNIEATKVTFTSNNDTYNGKRILDWKVAGIDQPDANGTDTINLESVKVGTAVRRKDASGDFVYSANHWLDHHEILNCGKYETLNRPRWTSVTTTSYTGSLASAEFTGDQDLTLYHYWAGTAGSATQGNGWKITIPENTTYFNKGYELEIVYDFLDYPKGTYPDATANRWAESAKRDIGQDIYTPFDPRGTQWTLTRDGVESSNMSPVRFYNASEAVSILGATHFGLDTASSSLITGGWGRLGTYSHTLYPTVYAHRNGYLSFSLTVNPGVNGGENVSVYGEVAVKEEIPVGGTLTWVPQSAPYQSRDSNKSPHTGSIPKTPSGVLGETWVLTRTASDPGQAPVQAPQTVTNTISNQSGPFVFYPSELSRFPGRCKISIRILDGTTVVHEQEQFTIDDTGRSATEYSIQSDTRTLSTAISQDLFTENIHARGIEVLQQMPRFKIRSDNTSINSDLGTSVVSCRSEAKTSYADIPTEAYNVYSNRSYVPYVTENVVGNESQSTGELTLYTDYDAMHLLPFNEGQIGFPSATISSTDYHANERTERLGWESDYGTKLLGKFYTPAERFTNNSEFFHARAFTPGCTYWAFQQNIELYGQWCVIALRPTWNGRHLKQVPGLYGGYRSVGSPGCKFRTDLYVNSDSTPNEKFVYKNDGTDGNPNTSSSSAGSYNVGVAYSQVPWVWFDGRTTISNKLENYTFGFGLDASGYSMTAEDATRAQNRGPFLWLPSLWHGYTQTSVLVGSANSNIHDYLFSPNFAENFANGFNINAGGVGALFDIDPVADNRSIVHNTPGSGGLFGWSDSFWGGSSGSTHTYNLNSLDVQNNYMRTGRVPPGFTNYIEGRKLKSVQHANPGSALYDDPSAYETIRLYRIA